MAGNDPTIVMNSTLASTADDGVALETVLPTLSPSPPRQHDDTVVMGSFSDQKENDLGLSQSTSPPPAAAFVGAPSATDLDHLGPTEETSKKLQLSLDELIERATHVAAPESGAGERGQPYRPRRGGRRHFQNQQPTFHLHNRSVPSRRSAFSQQNAVNASSGPTLHSDMSYYNVNGAALYGHPSSVPLPPFGLSGPGSYASAVMRRRVLPGRTASSGSFVPNAPPFGVPPVASLPQRFSRRSRIQPYPSQDTLTPSAPADGCQIVDARAFVPNNGIRPVRTNGTKSNVFLKPNGAEALTLAETSALADVEILFPPSGDDQVSPCPDNALVVKFKNTEVLLVRKARGDLVLSSGGWRTFSTRLVLNNALKPLGLWIESTPPAAEDTPTTAPPAHHDGDRAGTDVDMSLSKNSQSSLDLSAAVAADKPHVKSGSEARHQWTVVDGKFYLAAFQDGMVIGQIGASSRAQLMARASVVAQHLKQVKTNALARRQRYAFARLTPSMRAV